MQKIEIENELGLDVYINGIPKLENIPQDKLDEIISVLCSQLDDWLKQKSIS